jgi:lipopolysaccharide biosynthesis glycosyltransferase
LYCAQAEENYQETFCQNNVDDDEFNKLVISVNENAWNDQNLSAERAEMHMQ